MPKMTIQIAKKVSLSSMRQLYAKSATDKNLKAKANSMKPNTTFIMFIHEPDLGACFNHVGNKAKRVKGKAKAKAKPNIPTVGATQSPLVAACTRSKPTTGAVQEKDTNERVKAIKKIESKPVVAAALLSIALPHEEGKLSSNQPKKLNANTTNIKKKNMLNGALVANSFSFCGPNNAVIIAAKPI